MESLGFKEVTRSYYGWQRKNDAITILDARPDNFIRSAEGVVPIDLVVQRSAAAPNFVADPDSTRIWAPSSQARKQRKRRDRLNFCKPRFLKRIPRT